MNFTFININVMLQNHIMHLYRISQTFFSDQQSKE